MELTKKEIAERLMATAKGAESWDEVMTSVALVRVAALRLDPQPLIPDLRGECANCGGTGRNPGSDYNDCAAPGCTAAGQRVELEKFVSCNVYIGDPQRLAWRVDQRARQLEYDANAARIMHLTHERDTALRAVRLHTARIAELQASLEASEEQRCLAEQKLSAYVKQFN